MENKQIADTFTLLSRLMELHGENQFKIKSYQNAASLIKKLDQPLAGQPAEELEKLEGIGEAIAAKIISLCQTGSFELLDRLLEKTPKGIVETLFIKGVGPKKIAYLWQELGIKSVIELLYACTENRLVNLKGFGEKTQENIRKNIEFYLKSKNKLLFPDAENEVIELSGKLKEQFPGLRIESTGPLRRKLEILDCLDLLVDTTDNGFARTIQSLNIIQNVTQENDRITGTTSTGFPVIIHQAERSDFSLRWFETTGTSEHVVEIYSRAGNNAPAQPETEQAIYDSAHLHYTPPEMRENIFEFDPDFSTTDRLNNLITLADIRGIVHAHSHWSDGRNSLEEMARYCMEQGFEYLAITDHSKAAFYANGLSEERVLQQREEIARLNKTLAPFRIFHGIECDILSDGSLDYEDSFLLGFDLVIASVHSNLQMDIDKATERLLRAIEHPAVHLLGHPTGRLLLSREGYPVNFEKILYACQKHKVGIELNANPYRLDLDWRILGQAIKMGIVTSINPDAHQRGGIHDIYYGICAARKAGVTAKDVINTFSAEKFEQWLNTKRSN